MIDIRIGDCLQVMPTLSENSVDSVICDPPYGLSFMGKTWDHGVPGVEFWQAALRVAKPGAILLAFGGTRTEHRLTCAIEDAGWEIRDKMCWLFGQGFPKSMDIAKAISKASGYVGEVIGTETVDIGMQGGHMHAGRPTELAEREIRTMSEEAQVWQGWGTALKPAVEYIIVAMKPLEGTYAENAQKWGVAGLNIDGGRIGTEETIENHSRSATSAVSKGKYGDSCEQETHQTVGQTIGRWPANLLLDEESARLLGEASRFFYTAKASSSERNAGLEDCEPERDADRVRDDGVGGDNPRNRSNTPKQNFHPTVKPLDLMRYLCKLTRTPTGGVVLDPFMGSGTTGIACILEHRDFIGIEIDEKYAEIAKKRIADMEGPLFSGGKYGE